MHAREMDARYIAQRGSQAYDWTFSYTHMLDCLYDWHFWAFCPTTTQNKPDPVP